MKKNTLLTFVVILVSALLVACGGGGGSGGGSSSASATPTSNTSSTQSSISLSNVNQMMVAPDGLVNTTTTSIKNIYKVIQAALGIGNAQAVASTTQTYAIDPNGAITAVNLANLVSGTTSSATSDLVIDTPKFLMFRYNGLYQPTNNGASSQQCVLLGVRKSDGKFACVQSNPRCDSINSCQVNSYLSQIKVDPTGNIFFIVLGDGGLEKVDLTDPSNPVYTSIFTHTAVGDASYPVVNLQADVMTTINLMSGSTLETRIYSGNSLKYTLSESNVRCSFTGPSSDSSNFYYIANLAGTQVSLFKLTKDLNGGFIKTTVNNSADGSNGLSMGGTNCARAAQTGDKVFTIGYKTLNPSAAGNILYEPLNASATPTFYTLSADFSYMTDMQAYTGGLALIGINSAETSHGIQRFNTSTNALTTVLSIGTYKINSTTVSQEGEITFTGTTLASGAPVIGTVSKTNVLAIKTLSGQPTSIASAK